MRSVWVASNPQLAYNTGAINADEYYRMTGKYPPNMAGSSSGGSWGYGGGSGGKKGGSGSTVNKPGAGTADEYQQYLRMLEQMNGGGSAQNRPVTRATELTR